MPEPPRRVALFRALKLGDMLCLTPALRALRRAWPRSSVALIALPWTRVLTDRLSAYVDELVPFPGHPALPEQPAGLPEFERFAAAMRERCFDLVVQMHGSGTVTNGITRQLGTRVAGFYPVGQPSPDPRSFLPWVEAEPESRRWPRLLAHLGAPARNEYLEFPILPEERQELATLIRARGLQPGAYVCLHPGAGVPERRWPAEGFAAVGDMLAGRGLRVVLTGGPEECPLTKQVARAMHAPTVNLAGATSLGVLAALLDGAALLVCNDTGVSHLAAATRTPSVVITPVSDPQRWAPTDRDRHRVVDARRSASVADVLREVEAAWMGGCVVGVAGVDSG